MPGGDVNDVMKKRLCCMNVMFEGGDHLDVDDLDEDDRLRIVRLLLARGADVNHKVGLPWKSTPLYQACNCGDRLGLGAIAASRPGQISTKRKGR